MLKRYFQLRGFISADDEKLTDFLPSRASHRKHLSAVCEPEICIQVFHGKGPDAARCAYPLRRASECSAVIRQLPRYATLMQLVLEYYANYRVLLYI